MGCDTTGSRGNSSPVGRVMEAWKQSRTEFRSNSSSHTFASGTAAKTQQGKGGVHNQATQQSGRALHPVRSSYTVEAMPYFFNTFPDEVWVSGPLWRYFSVKPWRLSLQTTQLASSHRKGKSSTGYKLKYKCVVQTEGQRDTIIE